MADLNTLYCTRCGGTDVVAKVWINVNTKESISDIDDELVWCEDCDDETELLTLPELWKEFSNVPVNADDEIERPFLFFEKGTPKLDVWHWFDERCPNNLHDDLMYNKNKED